MGVGRYDGDRSRLARQPISPAVEVAVKNVRLLRLKLVMIGPRRCEGYTACRKDRPSDRQCLLRPQLFIDLVPQSDPSRILPQAKY